MTKYLGSSPFTSGANNKKYVDNWERTFGKKSEDEPEFSVGPTMHSRDGVHWFEEPLYGPERKPTGAVTAVDVEAGTITIESLPLHPKQREFLDE